jgi:UDP-N-acetylmuramoyl-tripeptide--D-alanyl-D-alanine ligase
VIADVIDAATAATALGGGSRWLRLAQREHYIAGSVTRFAVRWWLSRPENLAIGGALVASVGAAWAGWWEASAAAGVIGLVGPLGLSYRGRSGKLAWTRRLRTLAAADALFVVTIAVLGVFAGVGAGVSATLAAGAPVLADLALAATAPLERRLGGRFTRAATRRLADVSPRVVAITGSYGKTSTKFYTGHLLRAKYATVTSPASFNNMSGLSRAVNERLTPGTEVFVAEMGTYGPGEIRALCDWLKPEIAVITAIGPVHLERMDSLDNIARAKAEILERARVGVINIDYPHLADIAARYGERGGALITCSASDPDADVHVTGDGTKATVWLHGRPAGIVDMPGVFPGNAACAVGVALAFDIPASEIIARLANLPRPEHRQTVHSTENGITVIDDTYNSNPDGALSAITALASAAFGHRRVLVTPGMVELGSKQASANEAFARQAVTIATDILIVGRTNKRALLRGAAAGSASVTVCRDRPEAVAWVRRNLGAGDAVLYENDLPDHYP